MKTAAERRAEKEDPEEAETTGGRAKKRHVSATQEPEPTELFLKKNKPLMKPITPNFKKLNKALFKKIESIDLYVQRKTEKMEALNTSAQDPEAAFRENSAEGR
ncbi:hypothetical protein NHX12_022006 [Muraenolepis orangiensis]|uniref:Uncharacterized protein n=1 Tax=Muraenolepis orangiensis TaxID=630683 RepID=A0A9Q0IQZ7_9TELE|nr:hypothetical protein NHX12_022006 [Muraenolepis orangiensis]